MLQYLVGLGQPMESTGVMEALSRGCIFLNPQYTAGEQNVLQKQGKPTNRKVQVALNNSTLPSL